MSRSVLISCLFLLLVVSVGCVGAMGMRGALYTDVTEPKVIANSSIYQITPESDFEGIAYVEGEAQGQVILGLIATGNFGYGAAIENALSKAPGATRLIDMVVDVQIKSYLGVYTVYITKVRGRAVRVKQ